MSLSSLAISFQDVFQSEFLQRVSQFSIVDCAVALIVSFLLGLFIYFIYAKTFSGVVYSRSFNLSLVAMTMITSLIILGVTSNVVLSLGMVGALSIVRFRSAIKDPIDIVFLFWAISEGILCGAGLLPLALIGAAVIGALLLVFSNRKETSAPYLLIVRMADAKAEKTVADLAAQSAKRCRLKSRTLSGGSDAEVIYELRLRDDGTQLMQKLEKTQAVTYASLVSYDGNYTP